MRTSILFPGMAVVLCSVGLVVLAPGCNDSNPSEATYDNMLTDPPQTQFQSIDPVDADVEEEYAVIDVEASDSTIADPPKFHVASGPDRTTYVTGEHITTGADKSKYYVFVHVIGGPHESYYKRAIYEHITEGADKSKYKPKGGIHIDEGPNASSYRVPTTSTGGTTN